MRFSLPAAVRHPVALLGMAVTTVAAILFLFFLLLDFLGYLHSAYVGLLLFVAIPATFILGLVLIPLGVHLDARRRRRAPGAPPADWPVIDLRIARHRTIIVTLVVLTCINLALLSVASYGAVHYMETTAFCGSVCHETMEPQYVAHLRGPHARVPCVACHVGPGAEALVQSKLAGTRQLWQVATGRVQKPVPSPIHTMRPARFTCENCHWPAQDHGLEVRSISEFADDERNTETITTLTLMVGGGRPELAAGSGIHWHMNLDNQIEYVTTDAERETIPYVRLRQRDGTVHEYLAPGVTPGQVPAGELRRMDCMDCHSRPAHTFVATPERAVDQAIAQGRIPRELPFVRREAVAAVTPDYPNKQAALEAIAARLREYYKANPSIDARLLERATAGVQDVWASNVFPAMRVKWGTYPNQIGHVDSPGCFRCHDDDHKAKDGRIIRQDCDMCHKETE
jgi:NapC/NirT cytochrome c family, N-terminal region